MQRFEMSIWEKDDGGFVYYHDYAALEAENARLLDILASRSKYSIEPTTKVSADSFLFAQNAKLRKALSECMEAISGLGGIVAEVEDACSNWHERGHGGSQIGMFRIAHAVENPEASVAIAKAVVVEKSVREVLGDA